MNAEIASARHVPFLPLLTLALATFSIGTTEFAIQGLLPEVALDLGVSIPQTGLLVTGYALGVALGGPILAVITNRMPRKTALLGLMSLFVVGHVFCAVAPNYTWLMASRIISSFCHGAFFGIGSVVAVNLVPENRRASAVALMWGGIAASNILGVPAGTALGHAFGWRSTFWAVTLVGAMAMAAIATWLPESERGKRNKLSAEFAVLGKPSVLLALATCVFLCAGTFSVFTYIAPLLTERAGVAQSALPMYLLVFGVGGVIGMQVGGRFADRSLTTTIVGAFLTLGAVYLIQLVAFRSPTSAGVMMFVWGFVFYFPAAAIQLRVVDAAREAPNLASTLVQSGFNLGNAIGPYAGAALLLYDMDYSLLPWLGAALALGGAAAALWSAEQRAG